MNRSRVVAVVLAVVAVSALATSTLGFSSVTAERSVSVNVVNSSQAYVGVTACAPTHGNENTTGNGNGKGKSAGNAEMYVTVTNQYSSPIRVKRIAGGGQFIEPEGSNAVIQVGNVEKYPLQFDASEVTVEVGGNGFDATVTATVTDEQDRSDCNPSRP